MLKIADPVLARMWTEKFRIVLFASTIGLVLAALCDVVWTERHVALVVVGICVVALLTLLFEMRYRMSKGVYGQRPQETADFDRWVEQRGVKEI